jgi:hypothetical protein
MSNPLTDPWKFWIKENLKLGVSPTKIFGILVNNDFDLNEIVEELNNMKDIKQSTDLNENTSE